ncbi:hypothetical protein HU200_064306 [Digitaria exilis]|uniref:Uncharacterized protein n=1 Tax=Digitaria exilis TaxID=1010633 RepID=A0A835A257_9POAL|nr:hypothetical protein HU200_064306 [Digitaria exilis]
MHFPSLLIRRTGCALIVSYSSQLFFF